MPGFLFILLFPLAIALKIAGRLLQPLDSRSRGSIYQAIDVTSNLLMLIAALGTIAALAGHFAYVIVPLAIITLIMNFNRLRRAEHESLLGVLAISAEQGIPIAESAAAMQLEQSNDLSRRAGAMAEGLAQGMNLEQAVKRARLSLSTSSRLAVSLGGRIGSVSPLLNLQQSLVAPISAQLRSSALQFLLIIGQMILCAALILFHALKIMPVMQKILYEFGLKQSYFFELSITSAQYLIGVVPLLLLVLVVAGILLTLVCVGWIPRDIFPMGWVTRRYDSALVLASLKHSVDRGQPLDESLQILSEVYPLRSIRRRLAKVHKKVVAGSRWTEALQSVGLLRKHDRAVIDSAERLGNLSWALHAVSESLLRRLLQSANRAAQFLWPVTVLVLGVVIFVYAAGVSLVIIQLIQGLA